jgi:hypothetical protein
LEPKNCHEEVFAQAPPATICQDGGELYAQMWNEAHPRYAVIEYECRPGNYT